MTELRFQDPEAPNAPPEAVFGIDPFRAPLRTLSHLFQHNDYLGLREKLSLLPLAMPAVQRFETLRKRHENESVTEWWKRTNGQPQVLERFIRPFCRAVQFTEPEQFSAFVFLGLLHHVMFEPTNLRIAGYKGARDETIFAPLGRYLTDRGASIRVGTKLSRIDVGSEVNPAVIGFGFEGGERVQADAYVAAIPVWHLTPLLPKALTALPFFSELKSLPVCPAISVQLWFDRKVIGTKDYTLVSSSKAAVYAEQSTNAYPTADGNGRISVVVSPADALMKESDEKLIDLVMRSYTRSQPDLAEAKIVKSKILRHPQHLVRPMPGVMSLRPSQTTPVGNFFLAGDWTEQPYFGSQEGAVRSGLLCAKAMLEQFSKDEAGAR